jgi:hypothetical protein
MRHPWSVVLAISLVASTALTVAALDSGQIFDGRPPRGVNGGESMWATNGGVVNPNDERVDGARGIPMDGRANVFLAAEVKAGKAGLEPTANEPWSAAALAIGGGPLAPTGSASATPRGAAPKPKPRTKMRERPWSNEGKAHGGGDTGQGRGP